MRNRRARALIRDLADADPAVASAAREQIKAGAWRNPELRRALAEHYRHLPDPAQAGRWGITETGWARPREVSRMRLWLLGEANSGNFVRDRLALPPTRPVPPEVTDITAPRFVKRGPIQPDALVPVGCLIVLAGVGAGAALLYFSACVLWRGITRAPLGDPLAVVVPGVIALVAMVVLAIMLSAGDSKVDARDIEFVRRRAEELLDSTPPEGRVMLRALARHEDDEAARRALVEDARRGGRLADAGRWGCTVDGLTTAEERDAYAVALLRKSGRDPLNRLTEMSAIRAVTLPGDALDVLRRTGAAAPGPPPEQVMPLPPRWEWWPSPILILLIGALVATLAPSAAHVISAVAVVTALLIWAVACAIAARERARSITARWVHLVLGTVAAAGAVGVAATSLLLPPGWMGG